MDAPAFSYWIQHADFSVTDGGRVDPARAVLVFTAHDWAEERARQHLLLADGALHACAPGIGYFAEAPAVETRLDVRPRAGERAQVQFTFVEPRSRLLGIVPRAPREEERCAELLTFEAVAAIRLFVEGRQRDLIDLLDRARPPS